MEYTLKGKFSERNVWKIFGHLIDDISPSLNSTIVDQFTHLVRKRDVSGLIDACSNLSPLRIAEVSGSLPWKFKGSYQLGSLLRKYQFEGDVASRRSSALASFVSGEATCKEFNDSLYRNLTWSEDEKTNSFYSYCISFIERTIGAELPTFEELTCSARHGPGSTFISAPQGKVTAYYKYANWPYTVSADALPLAIDLIESDDRWIGALQDSYRERNSIPKHMPISREAFFSAIFTVVEGNRICFVPKDALKERTIAIEPTMNVYLQLGVDGFIRKRLRKWGIDLNSQTKNQTLAEQGSIDGSYATIDLKSASDTVSLKLCEAILPPAWYNYLVDLRSSVGSVPGIDEAVTYEKISSMGNGYTFALESLIFSAAVFATIKCQNQRWESDRIAVFGDDLVVPTEYANDLILNLSLMGFSTNVDKTFVEGPFRESCGKDYFKGYAVRPVFLKDKPRDVTDLYHLHNSLFRWLSGLLDVDSAFDSKVLTYIRELIPDHLRFFGPILENTSSHLFNHTYSPKNGDWVFRTVRAKARIWNPKDFLFRKLMHNLKSAPPRPFYEQSKVVGSESRFDVTRRDAYNFEVLTTRFPAWFSSNSFEHIFN